MIAARIRASAFFMGFSSFMLPTGKPAWFVKMKIIFSLAYIIATIRPFVNSFRKEKAEFSAFGENMV
jgi:hypothetical protein